MKVGFIGTGIMGSRMARNLVAAGHNVTVHNRTKANAQRVIEAGASWAETAGDAAKGATVVITMLPQPSVVREIVMGEGGLLEAMEARAIWMDSTTGNPMAARELAAAAEAAGVRYLEAPVAGTRGPAETGDLIFFVGGDAEDVEVCGPLFEAMGKRTIHVGEPGSATSLKLVVNYMLATTMAAFAEGIALGEALGLPREQLLSTLVGGPVAPPFLSGKQEKVATDDYSDTEFPLKWMQKDLEMVAETAYDAAVPMPLANLAKELYQQAKRAGLADDDFSAIVKHMSG